MFIVAFIAVNYMKIGTVVAAFAAGKVLLGKDGLINNFRKNVA